MGPDFEPIPEPERAETPIYLTASQVAAQRNAQYEAIAACWFKSSAAIWTSAAIEEEYQSRVAEIEADAAQIDEARWPAG